MTVETADAIELNSDRVVELRITIASDEQVNPVLIFGGMAADALRACDGVGAYMDEHEETIEYSDLESTSREMLLRYAQKTPGTTQLFGNPRLDSVLVGEAIDKLGALNYRVDTVNLKTLSDRTWVFNDEPKKRYPVHEATLQCTFDRGAFFVADGDLFAFAAPDLIAGVSDQAGAGPIRVAYDLQVKNDAGYIRTSSTFLNAREYVDEVNGERLVSFDDEWWQRNTPGATAILVSGGSVIFEPSNASGNRVLIRLLAGLLASFSIALAVIVVRRYVNHVSWLN